MSLDSSRLNEYIERARPLYPDEQDFPYHNAQHMDDVVAATNVILDEMPAHMRFDERRELLRRCLPVAAAFHDAGYGYDEKARGFATKEELAVQLAYDTVPELSAAERGIVMRAILGTMLGAERTTPEAVMLHCADLGYLAQPDYMMFQERLRRYWKEQGTPDWNDFRAASIRFGREAIAHATAELPIAGINPHAADGWGARAARNMTLLQSTGEHIS